MFSQAQRVIPSEAGNLIIGIAITQVPRFARNDTLCLGRHVIYTASAVLPAPILPYLELLCCRHPSVYKALNAQIRQHPKIFPLFTWTDAYSTTTHGKGRRVFQEMPKTVLI